MSVIPDPGNLITVSGLCGHQECRWWTDRHTEKTPYTSALHHLSAHTSDFPVLLPLPVSGFLLLLKEISEGHTLWIKILMKIQEVKAGQMISEEQEGN